MSPTLAHETGETNMTKKQMKRQTEKSKCSKKIIEVYTKSRSLKDPNNRMALITSWTLLLEVVLELYI